MVEERTSSKCLLAGVLPALRLRIYCFGARLQLSGRRLTLVGRVASSGQQPPFPPIRTRRWNDPAEPDDGLRILITRYRPRGVAKADETWDEWRPDLGPSRELHAAVYGKGGRTQITWMTYLARYRAEMRQQREAIDDLARQVAAGQQITLLCSSSCDRESRCHRSVLRDLIEKRARELLGGEDAVEGSA